MNPIVKTNNLVIHLPKEGAVSGSLGNPSLCIYIFISVLIKKELHLLVLFCLMTLLCV